MPSYFRPKNNVNIFRFPFDENNFHNCIDNERNSDIDPSFERFWQSTHFGIQNTKLFLLSLFKWYIGFREYHHNECLKATSCRLCALCLFAFKYKVFE